MRTANAQNFDDLLLGDCFLRGATSRDVITLVACERVDFPNEEPARDEESRVTASGSAI